MGLPAMRDAPRTPEARDGDETEVSPLRLPGHSRGDRPTTPCLARTLPGRAGDKRCRAGEDRSRGGEGQGRAGEGRGTSPGGSQGAARGLDQWLRDIPYNFIFFTNNYIWVTS